MSQVAAPARHPLRPRLHRVPWYVVLGGQGGQDAPDDGRATAGPDRTDDLIAALRAEVDFLWSELTARSEELRRKDRIVAGVIERLPELPAGDEPASTSAPPSGRPDDEPRPASEAPMLRWRR